jgi:hypothetical protein
MKKRLSLEPHGSHAFFHAMVVMGGSVAAGCGGVSTESRHGPESLDGSATGGGESEAGWAQGWSTGGGHSGGTPVTGGATNTGGAPSYGGRTNSGGATTGGSGGIAKCAPAQWSCNTGSGAECSPQGEEGVVLPTGCGCDSTRPTSETQCRPDQTFVCRKGIAATEPYSRPIPFQCSCVTSPATCSACDTAFGPVASGDYFCYAGGPDGGVGEVLCGCAFIYLR